ncbi:MAG: hypothetical protein V4689_11975 [Verrucomicrobiota bacterium]
MNCHCHTPPAEAPSERPKVLCYTVALDLKEVKSYRQQARMMVASLERSGFWGDIKIIHNGETEIFDCPHPNVEEIRIDSPLTTTDCYQVKFQARKLLPVEDYDWVLFLDTDIIVSTSLDGWFDGPEFIRYATEPMLEIQLPQFNGFLTEDEMSNLKRDGINSGAFVIKAEYFQEVLALWEKIDTGEATRSKGSDQPAWNRLLLDTPLPTKLLAQPEVSYFYHHSQLMQMLGAPLLHYCGCWDEDKIQAMQAKFITHFHTDEDGTLIGQLAR